MARLVVSQFISLDGVVEDPGGSEGSERGGWAFEFERGAEGDRFKLEEVRASDALLLGRVTFEGFASAWPAREGEFADKFNTMKKYVVSRTLKDPEWTNSEVISGDLAEAVSGIKREREGDILLNGSVTLAQALIAEDLVDEYRLMVFPTVLGAGKRLFGETTRARAMRLSDSKRAGETVILILDAASDADRSPS